MTTEQVLRQPKHRLFFSRRPLSDPTTQAHIFFPVYFDGNIPKCLCRLCTPALSLRDEENIQTLYSKLLEREAGLILHALKTRVESL